MRQNNCTEKSDRGTDIIKKYCSRFPSIRGMDRVRMDITYNDDVTEKVDI